jgi:hypothetical protein
MRLKSQKNLIGLNSESFSYIIKITIADYGFLDLSDCMKGGNYNRTHENSTNPTATKRTYTVVEIMKVLVSVEKRRMNS